MNRPSRPPLVGEDILAEPGEFWPRQLFQNLSDAAVVRSHSYGERGGVVGYHTLWSGLGWASLVARGHLGLLFASDPNGCLDKACFL